MQTTVAIVGAGDLGAAVAWALAASDCAQRLLLVDTQASVAAGKALDMQQAGAVSGWHTRLQGTDDISRVMGSAVCVLADRAGQPSSEWQGEDALALLRRLAPYVAEAPIVMAGALQGPLIFAAGRELGVPRQRLIGSAPEGLASAVKAIVALEARCSPTEVMLTVLGAPKAGFVIPWSEASIGGYALGSVLSQVQQVRVDALSQRLWPPGPGTLGTAAARVVRALLQSSRRAHSVLTLLDGEFGVRHRVGAVPARLSTTGIVETREPRLSTRERVQVETALGG
jgi:malate dehydrogenase